LGKCKQFKGKAMLNQKILNWAENQLGQIENTKALVGGITTSIYRLSTKNGASYVLRVYDNKEMMEEEPYIPHREMAALKVAAQGQTKAPKFIAYEPDASRYGYALLMMEALEGEVILQPSDMADWLKQSAESLAAIHQIDAPNFPWRYFPYFDLASCSIPKWAAKPQNWQKALEILRSPEPHSPSCFIHRDYHPANILWQNGKLSGVVDWPSACIGTAGLDVAHMRVNLVSLYDYRVADAFLAAYQRANPNFVYHPYWDLLTIGDFHISDNDAPLLYNPWLDLGMSHLTHALMLERAEEYLAHILTQF
jgi:aminoglycoside phosphotransferase (APT) family kinase protein